ncbi:hypothetical protein PISL3812_07654 [Talaromyces islandicus]|uniref:Kelch repeat protein n=1 Tax=Talaromyces islandicus TaxID=28573 RepID=A0A0U1M6E3_TALIS|nr:hypothetical protein PISL3812_07654 [Talaromyces islandicus]
MRLPLLSMACFAASWSPALSAPSLRPRQVNSNVASSIFLRRAYHSSGVLNGTVYIDGGEFSYNSSTGTEYDYSSNMIAISLDEDWTNSTVNLQSISKPSGVPDLSVGGMWVDHKNNVLYTGFAGRSPLLGNEAFQANGLWQYSPASGTWSNLNSTATSFTDTYIRPDGTLVASGNGKGYSLGGFTGSFNASGLLSYNFDSHQLTNTTVSLASTDNGVVQFGKMVFVPNFGPSGVLVSIGGVQQGSSNGLLSMDSVQIFDPASGDWYDQPVSGATPTPRQEFCLAGVASDNNTYEIFLYAGWGGHLGGEAVPFDSAFVLTLPGFHWVQASYPASHPRHALTCESIGGGQMLTIGGLDTLISDDSDLYEGPFQSADPFTYGLGVFDISTLTWKSSYSSSQTVYTPSSEIMKFYQTNGRLSALNNTNLKDLFSTQNFTGVPTSTASSPSSTGSTSSTSAAAASSTHSTHTGAIAGGVVGGVAGVALIAAGAFYFLRRGKRQTNMSEGAVPEGHKYSGGYNEVSREPHDPEMPPELSDSGAVEPSVELPAYGKPVVRHELG